MIYHNYVKWNKKKLNEIYDFNLIQAMFGRKATNEILRRQIIIIYYYLLAGPNTCARFLFIIV